MMRAVVVDAPGGIEKLEVREVAAPAPGAGEIAIDVAYAAANWSDIQKREGVYPDPVTYPAVIGLEVSGHVSAVGNGVSSFREGDRVTAITGRRMLGGYAERCVVDADYAMALPDSMSLALGAAFPVVTLTAYHLLFSAHDLKRGEHVLVHAISGGVGLMLTQIGVAEGAVIVGTAGSAAKAAPARELGAAHVVDRSAEDFVESVMRFTDGRGVDLVIDSLGGDTLYRSFEVLRTYGRIINIGEASGYPDFDIRSRLYERSTSLAGFELVHAKPGSARWQAGVDYVVERLLDGRLDVPIAGRFALDDVQAMHRAFESRRISGKLLLEIAGEGDAKT